MLLINSIDYIKSLKGTNSTWLFELYANNIKNSQKIDNDTVLYDILCDDLYNFTNISVLTKIDNNYIEHHLFVIHNNKFRFIYPANNRIEMTFEYTPSYITKTNIDNIMNGIVVTILHGDKYEEKIYMVPVDIFADLFYKND